MHVGDDYIKMKAYRPLICDTKTTGYECIYVNSYAEMRRKDVRSTNEKDIGLLNKKENEII